MSNRFFDIKNVLDIHWRSHTPNFKPLYALKVVPLQLSPECPSRSLGGRSWLLRILGQPFLVFVDINEQLSFSERLSNMKKIYEVKFHFSSSNVYTVLLEAQRKSSKMANFGQNQHQTSSAEQGDGIICHKKSKNGRF